MSDHATCAGVPAGGGGVARFKLIPEAHLLLFEGDRVLLLRRQNTAYVRAAIDRVCLGATYSKLGW